VSLTATAILFVAFLLTWLLREVPLRQTSAGEGRTGDPRPDRRREMTLFTVHPEAVLYMDGVGYRERLSGQPAPHTRP
jgi:hypothetical protein